MKQPSKKLTSILWSYVQEAVLFGLLLLMIILYYLYYHHLLSIAEPWWPIIWHVLTLLALALCLALIFGYWQASKLRKRLSKLQESMLYLVKGHLAHPIPSLGDDEIGKLGEQLALISKQWADQVNSLQRLSTNNAQLAEKAKFSAITEERQRLARELHDAVSQQLFAISMTATAISRTINKDMNQAKRQIALIEEMASVAQSEMRALLLHLRPVHLEGKRLAEGIRELLQELKAKIPMEIHFEMDEEIPLGKGVEDHLFRITQEALSNTLRHSKATKTEIRLHYTQNYCRLTIWDNGVGFQLDQQKHTSYGLVSMKERVDEIGGSMQIITAPNKGTRIDIRVPIVAEAKEDGSDEYKGED